jgi:tetratricopeptide (TPR) repeat protein
MSTNENSENANPNLPQSRKSLCTSKLPLQPPSTSQKKLSVREIMNMGHNSAIHSQQEPPPPIPESPHPNYPHNNIIPIQTPLQQLRRNSSQLQTSREFETHNTPSPQELLSTNNQPVAETPFSLSIFNSLQREQCQTPTSSNPHNQLPIDSKAIHKYLNRLHPLNKQLTEENVKLISKLQEVQAQNELLTASKLEEENDNIIKKDEYIAMCEDRIQNYEERITHFEEQIARDQNDFEKLLEEFSMLKQDHSTEMGILLNNHEVVINTMKSAHEEGLHVVGLDHEAILNQIRSNHDKEIENYQNQLKSAEDQYKSQFSSQNRLITTHENELSLVTAQMGVLVGENRELKGQIVAMSEKYNSFLQEMCSFYPLKSPTFDNFAESTAFATDTVDVGVVSGFERKLEHLKRQIVMFRTEKESEKGKIDQIMTNISTQIGDCKKKMVENVNQCQNDLKKIGEKNNNQVVRLKQLQNDLNVANNAIASLNTGIDSITSLVNTLQCNNPPLNLDGDTQNGKKSKNKPINEPKNVTFLQQLENLLRNLSSLEFFTNFDHIQAACNTIQSQYNHLETYSTSLTKTSPPIPSQSEPFPQIKLITDYINSLHHNSSSLHQYFSTTFSPQVVQILQLISTQNVNLKKLSQICHESEGKLNKFSPNEFTNRISLFYEGQMRVLDEKYQANITKLNTSLNSCCQLAQNIPPIIIDNDITTSIDAMKQIEEVLNVAALSLSTILNQSKQTQLLLDQNINSINNFTPSEIPLPTPIIPTRPRQSSQSLDPSTAPTLTNQSSPLPTNSINIIVNKNIDGITTQNQINFPTDLVLTWLKEHQAPKLTIYPTNPHPVYDNLLSDDVTIDSNTSLCGDDDGYDLALIHAQLFNPQDSFQYYRSSSNTTVTRTPLILNYHDPVITTIQSTSSYSYSDEQNVGEVPGKGHEQVGAVAADIDTIYFNTPSNNGTGADSVVGTVQSVGEGLEIVQDGKERAEEVGNKKTRIVFAGIYLFIAAMSLIAFIFSFNHNDGSNMKM